jgi:hypothetical protein
MWKDGMPMKEESMEEDFKGQGFVYWEEKVSPDGRFRVLYGYSSGEKSPTLVEPRIIEIGTGEVVVDLWHTYLDYQVAFREDGKVKLTMRDTSQVNSRIAEIDLVERTFAFADSPQLREPLFRLRARVPMR